MPTRSGILLPLATAIALLVPSACLGPHVPTQPGTIDGPEDPDLLATAHGTLVVLDRDDDSHLRVIRLPSLKERTVALSGHAASVSGPDDEGRVAYLVRTEGFDARKHTVRVLSLVNGSDAQVAERSSPDDMSSQMALAPRGGLVAFTTAPDDYESTDSGPWNLEVIDVTSKKSARTTSTNAMRRPCWFPDGRQLAFFEWRPDDRKTFTSLLDAASGSRHLVRETDGQEWLQGVAADGRTLMYALAGEGERARRVDVATGKSWEEDLRLPGLYRSDVVADLGDARFLYSALPTSGVEQRLRRGYVWPNDVKLADARTGKFVTVVRQMWGVASYGAFDREP
jgi:hypothetical protein